MFNVLRRVGHPKILVYRHMIYPSSRITIDNKLRFKRHIEERLRVKRCVP